MPRKFFFSFFVLLLLIVSACSVPVLNRPARPLTSNFSFIDSRYVGDLALGMSKAEVDLLYQRPTNRGEDFRSAIVATTPQGGGLDVSCHRRPQVRNLDQV